MAALHRALESRGVRYFFPDKSFVIDLLGRVGLVAVTLLACLIPVAPTRAASANLIKDINQAPVPARDSASDPQSFVEFNGSVWFTAFEPGSGRELWRTDGTAGGTELFKDTAAGNLSSYASVQELIVYDGSLFFTSTSQDAAESFRARLWRTDGTVAGTVLVKELRTATAPFLPTPILPMIHLTVAARTLFFSTGDGESTGRELWKSDGTEAGTVMVKDINPGYRWSSPEELLDVAGTLFFSADERSRGFLRQRAMEERRDRRRNRPRQEHRQEAGRFRSFVGPVRLHGHRRDRVLRGRRSRARLRALEERRHGGGNSARQGHLSGASHDPAQTAPQLLEPVFASLRTGARCSSVPFDRPAASSSGNPTGRPPARSWSRTSLLGQGPRARGE